MSESPIVKYLNDSNILVMLGPGGVGKTSSSVALAFAAASEGKRVGLLSIDPARRLADALGIKLGRRLHKINLDGLDITGSISASMVDQKAIFDDMVAKHAPSPKVREKILSNGLYQACSKYLGGAVEYMALAQLHEMHESKAFDIIILDTPPAQHVVDFLEKPNILSDFFDRQVVKLLLKPFVFAGKFGLSKMMSFGEKMMGGLAKVAGVQSLEKLAEFLILIQEVLGGFNKAGQEISTLLKSEKTTFIAVTSPHPQTVSAVKSLSKDLVDRDFPLRALLWNRDLPFSSDALDAIETKTPHLQKDLESLSSQWKQRERVKLESKQYYKDLNVDFLRVEEQKEALHSPEQMHAFSQILLKLQVEQ